MAEITGYRRPKGGERPSRLIWELMVMDVPRGHRIAELRREIELIEELTRIYRSKGKHHGHRDRADNEKRIVRLEEIKRELAVLRPK